MSTTMNSIRKDANSIDNPSIKKNNIYFTEKSL